MRMKDVNARKDYIQKVRKSFDAPDRRYEFEREPVTKGEAEESFSFLKVRLLLAVLLFAGYVFCDRTNTDIYRFSTKEISEKIAHDFNYDDAKEGAMQVWKMLKKE